MAVPRISVSTCRINPSECYSQWAGFCHQIDVLLTQQVRLEQAGQPLPAMFHEHHMVTDKHGSGNWSEQVHPPPSTADMPLIANDADPTFSTKMPAANSFKVALGSSLNSHQLLNVCSAHIKLHSIGQLSLPGIAPGAVDAICVTSYSLFHLVCTWPPVRPEQRIVNGCVYHLQRCFNTPDSQ